MTMGTHILANFHGCSRELLEKAEVLKRILNKTVSEVNFNKVGETFYQFEPTGATGVILLAESHISVHTWPERGSAAIDIFSCSGRDQAEKAYALLKEKFKPENIESETIIER